MKYKVLLLVAINVCSLTAQAQSSLERQGDQAMEMGFYKAAVDYYQMAAKKSLSDQLTYKLGDANRMADLYASSVKYYRQLAHSPQAIDFEDLYYHLADMLMHCGEYDSAYFYFNRYLNAFPSNEVLIANARQKIRNCEWLADGAVTAQSEVAYAVAHEGKNINSESAESGAVLIGDTMILFNSMQDLNSLEKENAKGKNKEKKEKKESEKNNTLMLMQIFEAPVTLAGKAGPSEINQWNLNSKDMHTGNVAYDPVGQRIFFNRCKDDDFSNIPCDIYVTQFKKGKWTKAVRMGGDVNMLGYTSTQPSVAYMPDSTLVLFFSSDRPGGYGGLDIWYTIIDSASGQPSECRNLGQMVNTPGNEITPFFDNISQRLYFSSNWHYGYGGYDVFYTTGSIGEGFLDPINMGNTLNSSANELYFSVNTSNPKNGYLASNRKGSFGNATCCNDIYRWRTQKPKQPKVEEVPVAVVEKKGAVHSLLPISLYFDNDIPDPKSELYTTTQTYFQTYNRYMFRRHTYKNAFAGVDDEQRRDSLLAEVDYFFDNEVHANCVKFEDFINLLIEDLSAGRRVSMTVEGYASPVHSSQYNVKISRRRVGTIVNQLMEYDHGRLRRFLSNAGNDTVGSLVIRERAYGSTRSAQGVSDNRSDASRSVYSVDASRERRIEIQDYQYLEDDSALISCLRIPSRAKHIGTFRCGEMADVEVHLQHSALLEQSLDFISVGSPNLSVVGYSRVTPGRDLVIYLRMDNRKASPIVSDFIPLTIRIKGEEVTQNLFLEYTLVR